MSNNRDLKENNKTLYKVLRILIHTVGCAQFSYSVYFDWNYVNVPRSVSHMGNGFGGKLQYLTFWDAVLQSLFFGICIINDVFGSNEINPKTKPTIRKIKDYLLASIAFPLAMFVGLTFWILMAIDRELVFPKILDLYFPTWLNHVMHTNIMVFSILEVITSFRQYPKRSTGLKGLLAFMSTYLIWTFFIYFKTGEWVYPVCNVLNWGQRIGFFAGLFAIAVLLYFVGELFNNKIWEKEVKQLESQKKSRSKKEISMVGQETMPPPPPDCHDK